MLKFSKKNKHNHNLIHGVLINMFDIGILIIGKSGIGKSELGLDLIQRNHIFIADDIVRVFFNKNSKKLIGKPSELLKKLMHVKGLGLLNIKKLFGKKYFGEESSIELIIELIDYIPLGYLYSPEINFEKVNLCEKIIYKVQIPMQLNKNLALRVEIITKQFILIYKNNHNTLDNFDKKQNTEMSKNILKLNFIE